MKLIGLSPIAFVILCLTFNSCKEQIDDPACPGSQIFISGECYMNDWVHELGGTTIIARNSYVGHIIGHDCIDTLIFYNDTVRSFDDERFGLVVPNFPGIQNVLGSDIPNQISESEFYASSVTPLCYINGEGRYANLHILLFEEDSVSIQFKFWTLNSSPGVFIDSTEVTFFKKQ